MGRSHNVPEGFAVVELPAAHRIRMRTTNGLERINRELKRRTRLTTLFPNPESCLRLVSALLTEFEEKWMTGKIYLSMNPRNPTSSK
jgi:putative transposase